MILTNENWEYLTILSFTFVSAISQDTPIQLFLLAILIAFWLFKEKHIRIITALRLTEKEQMKSHNVVLMLHCS